MRLSTSFIAGLALAASIGPASAQSIVWRKAEPIPDLAAYAQQRILDRAAQQEAVSGPRSNTLLSLEDPNKGWIPGQRVFVPTFRVDTTDPGGETTLFALRNTDPAASHIVNLQYFDDRNRTFHFDSFTLDPFEVKPINLRDVRRIHDVAGPNGISSGLVVITASTFILSGDYFQVDPANDFASGGRLVDIRDFCQLLGIRFLNGGAFTGGTEYRWLTNSPKGDDPSTDEPTFKVNVHDEAGDLLYTMNGYTASYANTFTADEVVGSLPAGSLSVFIEDDSRHGGGALTGTFSASGRFSVGVEAVCMPLPI